MSNALVDTINSMELQINGTDLDVEVSLEEVDVLLDSDKVKDNHD